MKIDREKIKGLHVAEYAEYVFEFPFKLCRDMLDLALLKAAERRHVLANYGFHSFYISDKYKSSGFLRHYKNYDQYFKDWHINYKSKLNTLGECRTEALTTLMLAGISPFEDCKIPNDWDILNLLDSCEMDINAKFAEHYYNTVLEHYKDTLNKRSKFDDKANERELERLENKDFDFAAYVINGNSCAGLLHKGTDIAMKLADELAELAFYKKMATGSYEESSNEISSYSMADKLKMLKDIGVLDLPFFSIDSLDKERPSEREQSRFLSKLLGYNEDNIRKGLKKIR